jgi:hypothetical protein
MKVICILLTSILSLGASAVANACSCNIPIEGTDNTATDWIKRHTESATFIFVARILDISSEPRRSEDIGSAAKIRILSVLKGNPKLEWLGTGLCQNFELTRNDTRVFFVGATGQISGCSEYRGIVSDDKLVKSIKSIVKANAN